MVNLHEHKRLKNSNKRARETNRYDDAHVQHVSHDHGVLQVDGISVPVTARRIFFVKQVEESSPVHESAPISSQRVVLATASDWSAKEAAATPVSQTMTH
jgi:hypothetical protein